MEKVFISHHPLVAHKLTKLRHKDTDPKRFRELIREIAGLLAYEATEDLLHHLQKSGNPLGSSRWI